MTEKGFRIEHDTMGEVKVPADRYWGAQTQRSFENFRIGTEKMPREIIEAFAYLKKAAALTNVELGMLDEPRGEVIARVCDEILEGKLEGNFPLAVWQTGSGTQSNMNVNEVVAARANELTGREPELHPNNHVNCSQSSNDTFPTAMHIAAVKIIHEKVFPSLDVLKGTFDELSQRYMGIIKTGRTHLQDATPVTLGQEISGWASMLEHDRGMLEQALKGLSELALGGTAVGTGLNAHEDFAGTVAKKISELTGESFVTAPNKFHALTSKDQIVFAHGALKALAADLMKIANDVRWMASGPRCGLGEIRIPENEPGSSIMPGKVNPTQCEAVTMVAVQVMGNDAAVGFAASQGNFELNVFMPVIIYNFLQSAGLLADVMSSFNDNCAVGITPVEEKLEENMRNSLMLVTALNPHIGYENAAKISKKAYAEDITLKEAALKLGLLTEEEFDRYVRPEEMTGPKHGQN
ncbi:MAG: class II fumarate hydratase [Clostridia bacterium]|nr:class II fumarate hydratase [Clostridia bacterium]